MDSLLGEYGATASDTLGRDGTHDETHDVVTVVVDNGQPVSVPEPSTVLLLVLGIAGLAFWHAQSRCNKHRRFYAPVGRFSSIALLMPVVHWAKSFPLR